MTPDSAVELATVKSDLKAHTDGCDRFRSILMWLLAGAASIMIFAAGMLMSEQTMLERLSNRLDATQAQLSDISSGLRELTAVVHKVEMNDARQR